MPCDLGYRSVAKVKIEAPAPELIETRTKAPELDAELLARLGQEDPAFLSWIQELDPAPLLQKALERLAGTGRIEDGTLIGRGQVKDRARLERLGRRWQLEVLRIVAELLDFDVTLEDDVIEGVKNTGADVQEFLRIRFDGSGEVELRFEHYKSERELEAEEDRFEALAAKLGIRIVIVRRNRAGQDIPKGSVHRHPTKGGKGKA